MYQRLGFNADLTGGKGGGVRSNLKVRILNGFFSRPPFSLHGVESSVRVDIILTVCQLSWQPCASQLLKAASNLRFILRLRAKLPDS